MNLSAYELGCGYIQMTEFDNRRVTLWHEHNVYHIRAHDFNDHIRLDWQMRTTLKDAWIAYNDMSSKYLTEEN